MTDKLEADMSATTVEDDEGRPEWEDQKKVLACGKCDKKFTGLKRKHHCRSCGKVFCSDCTNKRIELPPAFEYGNSKVRVCDNCYFYCVKNAYDANPKKVEKPDYVKVDAEIRKFTTDILKSDSSRWLPWTEKNGVVVNAYKLEASTLYLVRTTVTVNAPPSAVTKMYGIKELWKQFQPALMECSCREVIPTPDGSDYAELMYVCYKAPVVANRDMSMYSVTFKGMLHQPERTDCTTILSTSVDHPLCPPAPGIVRAWITMSCTHFEPVDDGKATLITSHVHTDPRGMIPKKVVNLAVSNAVNDVLVMKKFMEDNFTKYL